MHLFPFVEASSLFIISKPLSIKIFEIINGKKSMQLSKIEYIFCSLIFINFINHGNSLFLTLTKKGKNNPLGEIN